MFLSVFFETTTLAVVSRGQYTDKAAIPTPAAGRSNVVITDPAPELLSGPLEVVDDGAGGYTVQPKADTRPYCRILVGRDDGSGGFSSAWDATYKAFLFDAGETVKVQAVLAMDTGLTAKVPGQLEFRTPIVRNDATDLVVKLSFSDGDAARELPLTVSGIYRITAENAYKVRLLDPDGNLTDQVKIIVSE